MEIRRARREDGPAYLAMVRSLAEFEKLEPPSPEASARLLDHAFGANPRYQLWVADDGGALVGYAVTFETYSTFLARPTLYLEDLFVDPAARRRGVARAMLARLRQDAVDRGCGRMEWSVLAWNAGAIELYRDIGATMLEDWKLMRIEL